MITRGGFPYFGVCHVKNFLRIARHSPRIEYHVEISTREKHTDSNVVRYSFFVAARNFPERFPQECGSSLTKTRSFSRLTSHVLVLTLLYGALHTGRNLTDDLVTTATRQLHSILQDVWKRRNVGLDILSAGRNLAIFLKLGN